MSSYPFDGAPSARERLEAAIFITAWQQVLELEKAQLLAPAKGVAAKKYDPKDPKELATSAHALAMAMIEQVYPPSLADRLAETEGL